MEEEEEKEEEEEGEKDKRSESWREKDWTSAVLCKITQQREIIDDDKITQTMVQCVYIIHNIYYRECTESTHSSEDFRKMMLGFLQAASATLKL